MQVDGPSCKDLRNNGLASFGTWQSGLVGADFAVETAHSAVRIRPPKSLRDQQIIELRIGAAYGHGVTYRYRASMNGTGDPPARQLTASLDCPGSIVISERLLPRAGTQAPLVNTQFG